MALYAISDLHLSLASDKPMTVFKGWDNYVERIENNWCRLVRPEDTVVLPGDFSWSLKLQETLADFSFLNALPGKKILIKGNHDLWWSTQHKLQAFFEKNKLDTVTTLYNNCVVTEGVAVCGTRGWFYDLPDDSKICLREAGRLRVSLEAGMEAGLPIVLFLHYPPVYGEYVCREILEVIRQYPVTTVYHGHIHGSGFHKSVREFDGLQLRLLSADCIDFTPFFIK